MLKKIISSEKIAVVDDEKTNQKIAEILKEYDAEYVNQLPEEERKKVASLLEDEQV